MEKGCCLVDNGQLTSLTAPLVACRFLLSSPGRCVALLFLSFFFILRATQSPRAVTVDDKYTNADSSSRSRAQFHLVPFLRLSLSWLFRLTKRSIGRKMQRTERNPAPRIAELDLATHYQVQSPRTHTHPLDRTAVYSASCRNSCYVSINMTGEAPTEDLCVVVNINPTVLYVCFTLCSYLTEGTGLSLSRVWG